MIWEEACRILGVIATASAAEIHDQYIYKVHLLHPDTNLNKPEKFRIKAEEELKLVNQAYSFLSNPRNNPFSTPPKLDVTPKHIRFKDVEPGQKKRTSFEIKSVGGPYTKIWIDNTPAAWLCVTDVRSLTNEQLPLEVTVECTGIGEPDKQYACSLVVRLENEETKSKDEAIVKVELWLKAEPAILRVDANMIKVRDAQPGNSEMRGSPLREFKGVLDSFGTEPATGYDGTRVNLNFKDIEVIASTEPYNFPTAVINMGLSYRKKSKWGYMAQSLAELIPEDQVIGDQVGKSMRLVFCDGQDGRPAGKPIWSKDADREVYPTGEVPSAVWIVTEIEGQVAGAAKTTPADRAKELLDGKSLADFNKAAYADTLLRTDGAKDLLRSITDRSFVKAMVDSGEFTKNSAGVYRKAS